MVPEILDLTRAFAGALIGAAGFWLRGAAVFARVTGRGATTARVVAWAVPLALLAWLVTPLPWGWSLALAAALWLGCLPGWWGSIDLGRNEGGWSRDAALHTARGVLWGAPAAVVLWLAGGGWWWPLVAGLTCAPAYEIGWRLRPAGDPRRPAATELGELLFGAALGAAVIAGSWRVVERV
ncbi:hypothetical protein GXW78_25655 [Roseomonas terrae]|uniref:Uncharacterized protein n=1 Tax=Neoroseomonas terrae TaxID=424799 RepID=A0ABS5EPW2_9PROT|nr:hypothetical protein [Neoroseomonas terrae]MBR0653068.1 hypothetical protein [Neoroseomonas terrae]